MTEAQLQKRVKFWQKRLAPLGVGHFRIDRIEVTPEPHGNSNAWAAVHVSNSYDSCEFEFRPDVLDQEPEDADETIVHEWLHVFLRDFKQSIHYVDDQLSNAIQDMWDDILSHEEEGVVDRLARLVILLNSE